MLPHLVTMKVAARAIKYEYDTLMASVAGIRNAQTTASCVLFHNVGDAPDCAFRHFVDLIRAPIR